MGSGVQEKTGDTNMEGSNRGGGCYAAQQALSWGEGLTGRVDMGYARSGMGGSGVQ